MRNTLSLLVSFVLLSLLSKAQGNVNVVNLVVIPQQDSIVHMSWQTTMEELCSHFTILNSLDSINFSQRRFLAAAGNSSTIQNYYFDDVPDLQDTCYFYKLTVTDYDGNIIFSSVKKVCLITGIDENKNAVNNSTLYYDPVSRNIIILYPNTTVQHALTLYNTNGSFMGKMEIRGEAKFNCGSLNNGFYYYSIDDLFFGRLIIY